MQIIETLLVTSAQEWRKWLAQHHGERKEIWLIYYKKSSGKRGIAYEESVEEAWCFGWIDGATKGIDDLSCSLTLFFPLTLPHSQRCEALFLKFVLSYFLERLRTEVPSPARTGRERSPCDVLHRHEQFEGNPF